MKYIVISEENRNKLMALKDQFKSDLILHASVINPILISSGEYILPVSVLSDPAFTNMKNKIIEDGNESLIAIREVSESEFIRGE